MLIIAPDTYNTDGRRLTDRTLDAVRGADLVVRAGNLMHESVLDAFTDETDSFLAMYGSNDGSEIRDRVPAARNVIYGGVGFAMTHTRRDGNTVLLIFGREREVDAIVFGHSHRPSFHGTRSIPFLNPGSHTQPRGNRKAYTELEKLPGDGPRGRLVTVGSETSETFHIVPDE